MATTKAADRWHRLLPALWAGALVCIGAIATPAPFATLAVADAGRVVARVLSQEAYASVAIGIVVLLLERRAARLAATAVFSGQGTGRGNGNASLFSTGMVLALGAIFCTVLGYFAIQPLLPAARAGQGAFSFGQLHAASTACFVVKVLLVAALAWRNAAGAAGAAVRPASS
ncbi:MAG: DUF4149 domain-containing protein [Rubrivivax sp.]|nr:DUF4149 domain-containing protein [Rubrivivax sp.]